MLGYYKEAIDGKFTFFFFFFGMLCLLNRLKLTNVSWFVPLAINNLKKQVVLNGIFRKVIIYFGQK